MTPIEAGKLAEAAYSTIPTYGPESGAGRAIVSLDGLAVGFPGTNNVACAEADAVASIIHVQGMGALHWGFWGAYEAIRAPLLQLSPQIIYGHSEGAALAILYAADLILAGKGAAQLFGFEPPRVCADHVLHDLFASAVGLAILLTKNGNDLVPDLPPDLLENWQQPWSLTPIGQPLLPFPNLEDHKMVNVIPSLGRDAPLTDQSRYVA